MINILADTDNLSIEVSGHAGYADPGKDIVCAGVSSLVFCYLKSIRVLCGIEPELEENSKTGYVKITTYEKATNKLKKNKLLYKSLLLGLKEIEKKYPDYVRINKGVTHGT